MCGREEAKNLRSKRAWKFHTEFHSQLSVLSFNNLYGTGLSQVQVCLGAVVFWTSATMTTAVFGWPRMEIFTEISYLKEEAVTLNWISVLGFWGTSAYHLISLNNTLDKLIHVSLKEWEDSKQCLLKLIRFVFLKNLPLELVFETGFHLFNLIFTSFIQVVHTDFVSSCE